MSTTKLEALEEIASLRAAFELATIRNAIGPGNADTFLERLRNVNHYVMASELTQTHHYAALEKACGGRINPDTLSDLFNNRWAEISYETRAQYYEFMAGLVRMLTPVGEE